MKIFRIFIFLTLFIVGSLASIAQPIRNAKLASKIDSLRQNLQIEGADHERVRDLIALAEHYIFIKPNSTLLYAYEALDLAGKMKSPENQAPALRLIATVDDWIGNESKSMQITLRGIKIAEAYDLFDEKIHHQIRQGVIHARHQDFPLALRTLRNAKVLSESKKYHALSCRVDYNIGETYRLMKLFDSAAYYCQKVVDMANADIINLDFVKHRAVISLGKVEQSKGNFKQSIIYLKKSLLITDEVDRVFGSTIAIAYSFKQLNQMDSSLYYAMKAFEGARNSNFHSNIIESSLFLAALYTPDDPQKALEYTNVALTAKENLELLKRTTTFETLANFDLQQRQFEIDKATTAYQNQMKQYALIAGFLVLLIIALILLTNYRKKKKANVLLEATLDNLKATQSQLIQSEKMASLGELTAGIAHEIQNPLNFVNNFAEVSSELIEELKEERTKEKAFLPRHGRQAARQGKRDETLEEEILNDVTQNLEKINHHGQRASGIVKGMLEHSRTSTGKKELTDINVLADEYLRLSYHGLRAKDKSFNADFKMEFDESIPKLNVVSQDIGRVLLNLINNAFYAADKKSKKGIDGFRPEVKVTTEKVNDKVEIKVWDNGEGIPEKVRNKIFQPFFTTKPTGSGTGLGLSLAYDIITKGHNGELEVETEEGKGSRFVVRLPVV